MIVLMGVIYRARCDDRMTDGKQGFGVASESGARPLRDVRAERLLSLRELARLAGVAPSTIYLGSPHDWEKNTR